MDDQLLNKLISDFDRQRAVFVSFNKGYDRDVQTSTFKFCLSYRNYRFKYLGRSRLKGPPLFLMYDNDGKEYLVNIKEDEYFERFLEHIKQKGFAFKCFEENGNFLYIVVKKTSALHYFLKYLAMCI